MLKDLRIKKVFKQISGIDKNIKTDTFTHNNQHYSINRFVLFCINKFFPAELSVYENYFFKNNYFVRPSYEFNGHHPKILDYKNIFWVKFNFSTKVTNFLTKNELSRMQNVEKYYVYNNGVYLVDGMEAAAGIIKNVLFSEYIRREYIGLVD